MGLRSVLLQESTSPKPLKNMYFPSVDDIRRKFSACLRRFLTAISGQAGTKVEGLEPNWQAGTKVAGLEPTGKLAPKWQA